MSYETAVLLQTLSKWAFIITVLAIVFVMCLRLYIGRRQRHKKARG